jgi:hypothetical protein
MYETISKAMASTLTNHNEMFLNGITNVIKEAFSLDIQNRGLTYSIPTENRQAFIGQTSGDQVSREPVVGSQRFNGGNVVQQSVQQPMIDYNNGHSVAKIAPQGKRHARDFNAPPYQGRVAPREVPPGYHSVSEYYTLNAYENPGYLPNPQRMQNNGYLEPNNVNQQGAPF